MEFKLGPIFFFQLSPQFNLFEKRNLREVKLVAQGTRTNSDMTCTPIFNNISNNNIISNNNNNNSNNICYQQY